MKSDKPLPIDYARRNRSLAALGFNSYSHYLNSEMWQTIRGMVLKRDGGRCKVCGGTASNVHHNSYEVDVLIGKDLRQLVSLCRYHHERAEFTPANEKRDLPAVRECLKGQGVEMPPLVHLPTPKCFKPEYFDPLRGLNEKRRKKILDRVRREKERARIEREANKRY